MLDVFDIEKSVRRRVEVSPVGVLTVHRTGETPRVRHLPSRELSFRDAKSGRVLIGPGDTEDSYRVGGIRKQLLRTADVIREGEMITTIAPRPNDEFVNGLSDKINGPKRPKRSRRSSKGGGKKKCRASR